MSRKSVFAATLIAGTLTFGGTAFAGSPNHGPNPCEQPEAMPEYCTNPGGDGFPGEPEDKPDGHKITDLTSLPGNDIAQQATRPVGKVITVTQLTPHRRVRGSSVGSMSCDSPECRIGGT